MEAAHQSVLSKSGAHEYMKAPIVRGHDFQRQSVSGLLSSFGTTGFQGTNLSHAVDILTQMWSWTLDQEPVAEDEDPEFCEAPHRASVGCKVFLAFDARTAASGAHEQLSFLCQHQFVQVVATTGGAIDADLFKQWSESELAEVLAPLLESMCDDQASGVSWTPSKFLRRLGLLCTHSHSFLRWCAINQIPVFCPGLTDSLLGLLIVSMAPALRLDVVEDIGLLNTQAIKARKTGVFILGGGVPKHHVLNANLLRNGADFGVYLNTAQEFDGSDGGARPEEALSWGKLRLDSQFVKVYLEPTLGLPLMIHSFLDGTPPPPRVALFDKGLTASELEIERQKYVSAD